MLRSLALASVCVALMAQPTAPSFETVSIHAPRHAAGPDGRPQSILGVSSPGVFQALNQPLAAAIEYAYGIPPYQLSGPAWLSDASVAFDIEAKAPAGAQASDIPAMVRMLLADRFHLRIHREPREVEVYNLVALSTGVKLDPIEGEDRSETSAVACQLTAKHAPMPVLALWLSAELRKPVLDKTGIKAAFNFVLDYDLNEGGEHPYIFDALPDQLGVRLDSAKATLEFIVVDALDRLAPDK